jgi:hypothetical protein
MRFAVVPIFVRGRMLDRRKLPSVAPVVGELRIEYLLDPTRHRYLMFASLRSEGIGMPGALLPDPHGAQLIGMSPLAFSLAGFERLEEVEYAQSWIVSIAPLLTPGNGLSTALPVAGVAI